MICHLAPHARLVVRRDDLVVLDVENGAYSCLPGAGDHVAPAGEALEIGDSELVDLLHAQGWLAGSPGPPRPAAPAPRRDLDRSDAVRAGPFETVALALAYADVLRHFHGRSFGEVIAAAAAGGGPPDDAEPGPRVLRQVAVFRRWLPWIPFQGDCLYRSFLLRRALQRRGHQTLWVFGVRTWPFEAHCWLQIGDTVLDDAADRVGAFTPIMVV